MKKVYVIAAASMLLAAPAANAQAFLNKLKDKAGEAISGAISEKINQKVNDKVENKVNSVIADKTGLDMKSMKEGAMSNYAVNSKETLQPRRSSSFGWSGTVTPSSAKFPIPLMNEFPAVPSAAKLANPTEEDQIAFYKAVKAVTLKAEELNEDTTCEDQFTEKWRQEAEKSTMDMLGITRAEMDALNNGTLTPEEEERLAARIQQKIFAGVDMNELDAAMKKNENMTENDVMNMSIAASDAVFDKYDAQLRKYFNSSAAEYKKVTRESMANENSAASRALEKKAEAHMKTLDPATQKEAKAFQSKLQKELMQASMNAIPGANMAMQISQNVSKLSNNPIEEKMKKLRKYQDDLMAAWPKTTWNDADAQFSEADRKKVEAIKARIYATDKPEEYNPLYLQAMELVKTYRERAAKVWGADVQKRFDVVKNGMGDVIKIQRQAIADGVIPECALWRAPLNLVIEAGDILAEAYSEFPCNYPSMYSEDVVREVKLNPGELAWWPEFFVASNLDDVLAGKEIFKETSDGCIYQFNRGQWSLVPANYGENMVANIKTPASTSFKSSDGKREVNFNADGGFLQFPEGDIVYPAVWDKRGNELVWAENETIYNENGDAALIRIIKCTYKL